MSYDLYADNESKATVASNSGWIATAKYLAAHGGKESKELRNAGVSDDPKALGEEIGKIVGNAPAPIASVLKEIQHWCGKAKAHIGISQEGPAGNTEIE